MQEDTGKQFENAVYDLLRLKGVTNLTRERQFSSKKADIYFEANSYGSRRRYAVECKGSIRTLSQANVAEIYAGYAGLFATNEITDLLVVTPDRLAPSAISYVESISRIGHLSISALRHSLIDFSHYHAALKATFLSDPARQYYIPSNGIFVDDPEPDESDQPLSLHDQILKALDLSKRPIAVLGAYGIGKTTLSRELFLSLLSASEASADRPLPIYIPLDLMAKEQTLEGLLGTLFTSIYPSAGYNFATFCALNEAGHFVVILDGFDEMRHRLTWEEFHYNIEQLNIITGLNSKSVLLGRPSAFMDEEEYSTVISGGRNPRTGLTIGQRLSYNVALIQEFTAPQIDRFCQKFCDTRYSDDRKVKSRISSIFHGKANTNIRDLACRPVQLMMLLEILPSLPIKVSKLTRAAIYSLFVDELIRREKSKRVKRQFSPGEHRLFARKIALWLWLRSGNRRVEANQIEPDMFAEFLKGDADVDTIRRSLISASFLTTEGGTHLHFPHRSIQEFLVAERLVELAKSARLTQELRKNSTDISDVFKQEVFEFIGGSASLRDIESILGVFAVGGVVPQCAFALLVSRNIHDHVLDEFRRGGDIVAAWICVQEAIRADDPEMPRLITAAELIRNFTALIADRAERYVRETRVSSHEDWKGGAERGLRRLREASVYLACALILVGKDRALEGYLVEAFGRFVVFKDAVDFMPRGDHAVGFYRYSSQSLFRDLGEQCYADRVSLKWTYIHLERLTAQSPRIAEWWSDEGLDPSGVGMPKTLDGSPLVDVLRTYPGAPSR
jgi:hypothetical protein